MVVAAIFLNNHRGRFSLAVNTKLHVSEQKFNARKYKTMRLNESYRLVTTVLVLNSHFGKIHNIFLTTTAAVVSFQPRSTGWKKLK